MVDSVKLTVKEIVARKDATKAPHAGVKYPVWNKEHENETLVPQRRSRIAVDISNESKEIVLILLYSDAILQPPQFESLT